jgi:hypothetical protein
MGRKLRVCKLFAAHHAAIEDVIRRTVGYMSPKWV